jgi:formylglycine-generating enzyme
VLKPRNQNFTTMQRAIIPFFLVVSFLFIQWHSFDRKQRVVPKKMREEWTLVPGGKAFVEGDTVLISEFLIQKTEVTNKDYKLFLTEADQKGLDASRWQMDTTVWVREFAFGEPYKHYYHSHPAYDIYPVVGISYEGAMAYCRWKETQMEAQLNGEYEVTCKLPSHGEWVRAARGDKHWASYAWGGPRIRNEQGRALCNYSVVGDEAVSKPIGQKEVQVHPSVISMGVAGHLSDNADILAPVYAYAVNDYGCTNMNGNAAELLEGGKLAAGGSWRNTGYDVRNESVLNVSEPVSYVGFRAVMTMLRKN